MPVAVQIAPPGSAPIPPRKRWTRPECAALEKAGLIDKTVELVDGDLIAKMSKKRPHVSASARLAGWLIATFGIDFVNSEAPIDVAPEDNPTNQPEPDAVVLTRPTWEFSANPQPSDLRLVIEISDATLAFDTGPKALLYARAGIPEYWVLDLAARRMIVHRDPQSGRYSNRLAYTDSDILAPLAAPTAALPIASLFRPVIAEPIAK